MDKYAVILGVVISILIVAQLLKPDTVEQPEPMIKRLSASEDIPTFLPRSTHPDAPKQVARGPYEEKKVEFSCAHSSVYPNASISVIRTMNPAVCSFKGERTMIEDGVPKSEPVAGYSNYDAMLKELTEANAPYVPSDFNQLCREYMSHKACNR